jgi:hypothetical protein
VTSTAPPAQLPTSRNAVHRCATGKRKLRSQALHLLLLTSAHSPIFKSCNLAHSWRLRHWTPLHGAVGVGCVVVGTRGARDALSMSGAGAVQQHVPIYLWI